MIWQTARREIRFERTLVTAILNVTPDSFSDGGEFYRTDDALRQAERLIEAGADILDIGGESTRPNAAAISEAEETGRVLPVIEAVAKRFDVPVSVDTTKALVAKRAAAAGAEIINDISGLRFDERMAQVAHDTNAALILMHLRGDFQTMHRQTPVENIFDEVSRGFRRSLGRAAAANINPQKIALDVGIGFSKTFEQNLQLIARLDEIRLEFPDFPLLVGASRKSFIGKILDGAPTEKRLAGSLAAAAIAAWNGAHIVRVHDAAATVDALKVVNRLADWRKEKQ